MVHTRNADDSHVAVAGDSLFDPFRGNHERAHALGLHQAVIAAAPDAYRRIGIVGGGTAGFLTALALRAKLPHLEITLIESKDIPIIGVGEATTGHLVPFLHLYCKIDVHEFYREVRPTWKQGIKFEWGTPDGSHFQAPFDWDSNNVGVLGSLAYDGNPNAMTLEALLMEHDASPIVEGADGLVSLLPHVPFGYHLENRRLVAYLHKVALARGIAHLDRKITDIALTPDGQDIDHLVTDRGENLAFDLYFDCTGFRSLLLEHKLGSPFLSYAGSLFTDRALTFSTPHGGRIKPYTTATTMNSGWTWTIPHDERDNHGYVFSSAHCTPEEAHREARARWPSMGEVQDIVRFRSGRHADAWKGNVIAVGNAHGFVEPLESSGLLMICLTIQKMIAVFPRSKRDSSPRQILNAFLASRWDGLRWFLAIHYKFNRRLDTPFWQAARADTDVSGGEALLRAFQDCAPLGAHGPETMQLFNENNVPVFFGLQGWDCLLIGQGVPARAWSPTEPHEAWQRRKQAAMDIVARAVTHTRALELCRERPELLEDQLHHRDGWIRRTFPFAAQ
jgi:tryptophan halogenase